MGRKENKTEICSILEEESQNVRTNLEKIVGILCQPNYLGSQANLGKEIGVSQSAISKVKTGTNQGTLPLILYLQKKYHLSLELLKERQLSVEELISYLQGTKGKQEDRDLDKYTGHYFTYYFNNSSGPEDGDNAGVALNYGLIGVYRNERNTEYDLDVRAVIGLDDQNTILQIKKELDAMDLDMQRTKFEEIIKSGHGYKGILNVSPSRKDILAMSLDNSIDSVQILMPRPTLKDTRFYLGGLGTINSVSRNEYKPCMQLIALSRNPLTATSTEEIAQHLYMEQQNVSSIRVQNIFYFVNRLYKEMGFDEDQLYAIIVPYLKMQIEREMQQSQTRFYKVSDDIAWYKMIKPYHKEENNERREK